MRAFLIVLMLFVGAITGIAQVRELPKSNNEVRLSFSKTVKKVAPAVVNVFSSKKVVARQSVFANDPFLERFFGREFGGNKSRIEKSLGSGVIVDKTGILVTNYHVIKGGTKIRVVLKDMREFDAKVILTDERTDLAILQIISNGEEFPFLKFANSDAVEVGDLTLALGNPFGVGQTVTSGIVSAIARTNVGISDFQFFIQTDAAINPGNSGGALVDSLGQLIGINTAIFSRSGGSNGIGFAIPANMVRLVVNSSKLGDRVLRPWMGAELQPLNADIALSLGMKKPNGVLIRRLSKNSPLFLAGVKTNDVIIALGSTEVKNKAQLSYLLASESVGKLVVFSILRDEKTLNFNVTLIAAPETPKRRVTTIAGSAPFAGATVMNISPAVIEELSLPLNSHGVIISKIAQNSKAARFGFKVGDIILAVSGAEIRNVGDLITEASYNKRFWRFSINRQGQIINSIING